MGGIDLAVDQLILKGKGRQEMDSWDFSPGSLGSQEALKLLLSANCGLHADRQCHRCWSHRAHSVASKMTQILKQTVFSAPFRQPTGGQVGSLKISIKCRPFCRRKGSVVFNQSKIILTTL